MPNETLKIEVGVINNKSGFTKGLTTQCDRKNSIIMQNKWRPEPTQKNGVYTKNLKSSDN